MSEAAPRLRGPLAEALERHRDRCNAAFAQVRHQRPQVDGAAFADHLCERVAPLVDAVAAVAPDRVGETALALYDLSLDMLAAELLRRPEIDRLWQSLLPATPRLLAEQPRPLVASLANAAIQIAGTPDARGEAWAAALHAAATASPPLSTLLAFGQVAAWTCGLPHYREAALQTARTLPAGLLALALGASPDALAAAAADAPQRLETMAADRWLSAQAPLSPTPTLKIVARAGAFRGFGGLFRRPPDLWACDDALFASDGAETWQMSADAFGVTFHRVELGPLSSDTGGFRLERDGTVHHPRDSRRMAVLADARSWACTHDTLAVALPSSHQIFLVAATRG